MGRRVRKSEGDGQWILVAKVPASIQIVTRVRQPSQVQTLTLEEKVNITTGVGWMHGLCVGNTPRVGNFPGLCLEVLRPVLSWGCFLQILSSLVGLSTWRAVCRLCYRVPSWNKHRCDVRSSILTPLLISQCMHADGTEN